MLTLLPNIMVVLVRPRFPENIGSAARVVANMGLGGLRVVAPVRLHEEPMQRLATCHGTPVLEAMRVTDTLDEALADCVASLAFTSRLGARRGRLMEPRAAAARALDWAQEGKAALVFGPEDNGLSTDELDRCFVSVCIPTSAAASLNLAQAVMVAAYEVRLAALAGAAEPAITEKRPPNPPPASQAELAELKEHLIESLVAVGVIPADNPEHFFRPFKTMLERAGVSSREVRALRGVARQVLWLSGQIKKNSKIN